MTMSSTATGESARPDDHTTFGRVVRVPAFVDHHLGRAGSPGDWATLREAVASVTEPAAVSAVLDEIRAVLIAQIDDHAYRTLIRAFHEFREQRGLPASTCSDEALRRFAEHLREDGGSKIDHHYPVLAERMEILRSHTFAAVREALERFRQDRNDLIDAGLATRAPVERIVFTGADLHQEGRQVLMLQFGDGARLVYKPRPLETDGVLRDVLDAVAPFCRVDLSGCVPASLSSGDYGWQRFVEAAPMATVEQTGRYFYRFGVLAAVLGSLGATDLHNENVVAAGEYPCLIDTETILPTGGDATPGTLAEKLVMQMRLSPAQTMLLPTAHPGARIDFLVTGFGVGGGQTSQTMTTPAVRHADTDAVAVEWEPVTFAHTNNLPRLGEDVVDGLERDRDVRDGLLAGVAAVRGADLAGILQVHRPRTAVRVILRPTWVYGRYLDAGSHPRYLQEPGEAARLLSLLRAFPNDPFPAEQTETLLDAERAALRIGDIPYFTAAATGTAIRGGRYTAPDVLHTSPEELARAGLALAAARTDSSHLFEMEECLAEAAERLGTHQSRCSVFREAVEAGPGDLWSTVAGLLADLAVSFGTGSRTELGWVCGIGPDRGAPTLVPGSFVAFHDNGGIVTFLQRAAERDDRHRATADAGRRGLASLDAAYPQVLAACPESVFSGTASRLLRDVEPLDPEWWGALAGLLDDPTEGIVDDVATGVPGVLMLLADRLERGDHRRAGLLVDRLERPDARGLDRPWFDLAHGELGRLWALARVGRALDESHFCEEAADRLGILLAGGCPDLSAGWCGGAAGLLLAWTEIAVSAGRHEWLSSGAFRDLRDAALTVDHDQPVDLSVCHGSSGVIQSVLAVADLLGEPSLIERAGEFQCEVLHVASSTGWSTGSSGRTSLIGYMLGWSGVADTDLFLKRALCGDLSRGLPAALRVPEDQDFA